jgi:carboxypeptidase Taq
VISDLNSAYKELLSKTKDLAVLSTAEGIIHWDMETMMPPKAITQRSEQLALLSRIHHKLGTDHEIGRLLDVIQKNVVYQVLTPEEKRNIYLINKGYCEQTALPEKLVSDITMQGALTVNVWKKAKAKKDFSLYKDDLQKLLDLSKQAADILMEVKGSKTRYDALIDNFEPNMPSATISKTFSGLLAGLKPLIGKIEGSQTKPKTLDVTVPVESQRRIAQLLTAKLGYDTQSASARGRVDETEHPFTSGYYDDVRITTHYYPGNFTSSIFSVLHESGHAIYEQNLPQQWMYQPIGSPCSYGIHESQSRFYENIVGRSREFWMGFLSRIQESAPVLGAMDLDTFLYSVNRVARSKIRIEADEVTYSLHIIIRFEIERDLFADKITIDELPQVWNEKYADYMDLEISNDSEGVMQDTHWASGLYGYFPSYALGNIYDGQIIDALTKSLPNWRSQIAEGQLEPVNQWLKLNIHCRGNLTDPEDLIKQATGSPLDSKCFLNYLNEKYSALYGF